MKVIVAGSRSINDYNRVSKAIKTSGFLTGSPDDEIVCGMAKGPDLFGRQYAIEFNIKPVDFPADWDKYGKRAGMVRNHEMGDYADGLVSVWDQVSRGTKDMIDYMTKLKKQVYVELCNHPLNDGKTHINIYSKGLTQLGKDLSNFALTPIDHPRYGYFKSLEGFWYWMATGFKHEELRNLWGYKAKQYGKTLGRVEYPFFIEDFEEALEIKLKQHPRIAKALADCSLPLDHYYFYGPSENPRITYPNKVSWIVTFLERYRRL